MKAHLIELFSGGNKISSKRVFGGIGFLCVIGFAWAKMQVGLFEQILYISAGLIGADSVAGIFNKKSIDKNEPPKTEVL